MNLSIPERAHVYVSYQEHTAAEHTQRRPPSRTSSCQSYSWLWRPHSGLTSLQTLCMHIH